MRKISFIIPLSLLSSLTGCGGNCKLPNFENGRQINFVAYAGPCVPVYHGVNTQTDDNFRMVAEAGFTHVLALYEGNYSPTGTVEGNLTAGYEQAEAVSRDTLDFCQKYGLKYYVRDWNLHGMGVVSHEAYNMGIRTEQDMKDAMKYVFPDNCEYIHHPAYAGNYVCDEPYISELEGVSWATKAYMERMAELGVTDYKPYVNLNPCSASVTSVGASYTNYLTKYIQYMGSDLGYISYDGYPLKSYNGEPMIKTLYLYNLELVSKLANEYGIEFKSYIQSKGDFTGIRDMKSTSDIRFQAYCNLAFGSYDMTYYEYGGKNSAADGEFSLFNVITGEYNWTYNSAKTVNKEIHNFEKIITNYRYDSAACKSVDETYENQCFLNLDNPLVGFDKVNFKSVTQDTLMTKLINNNDESEAYMLVNFSDPGYQEKDTVTLKFEGAKELLMYRLGQKMTVKLPKSGEYTFVLGSGEGRFIIPLK